MEGSGVSSVKDRRVVLDSTKIPTGNPPSSFKQPPTHPAGTLGQHSVGAPRNLGGSPWRHVVAAGCPSVELDRGKGQREVDTVSFYDDVVFGCLFFAGNVCKDFPQITGKPHLA